MTVIQQLMTPVRRRGEFLVYALPRAFDDEVDPVNEHVDDPGMLDAFVAIASADDAVAFAERFGAVGWSRVQGGAFREMWPKRRRLRLLREAFADLQTGELRGHVEVDNIEWVLYHASWMSWCMDVARRQRAARDVRPMTLSECLPVPRSPQEPPDIARLLAGQSPVQTFSNGEISGFAGPGRGRAVPAPQRTATLTAARLVHHSINSHVSEIREQALVLALGGTFEVTIRRSGRALIDALYFELAQRLADQGGRLQLCAREDCGRTFYTRDERTTYCPPVSGKAYAKSPCYEIVRQRLRREENRKRGLTARGAAPVKRQPTTVGPTVTRRAPREKGR